MLIKGWRQKMNLQTLFDKNTMIKMQKQLEKSQSTQEIELSIVTFINKKKEYEKMTNEQSNYFIMVDSSEIKSEAVTKMNEWL